MDYGLMLENSKNVGNFCGDEKFFVVKIFFEPFFVDAERCI